MACPFAHQFASPEIHGTSDDDDVNRLDESEGGAAAAAPKAAKPNPPPHGADSDDARFDYDKDPVKWFTQNQIRSEEEFQKRKAELRATARARLDAIFARKGKRLEVGKGSGGGKGGEGNADGNADAAKDAGADADDDTFSVDESELSAWDSDVASVAELAGGISEWRRQAQFAAPAEAAMQLALLVVAAIAGITAWTSLGALRDVNKFWGVITYGWLPGASFACAVLLFATAAVWRFSMGRAGKRAAIGFQAATQLLYAAACALALVAWLLPPELDRQLKTSASCVGPQREGSAAPRLCRYLPAVEAEVARHAAAILTCCAAEAAAAALALALSGWHAWEVAFVEKRAAKYRRRNRRRKGGIPWERIRVEDLELVTTCGGGGGGGGAAFGGGTRASGGGGCPVAMMGEKKVQ